MKELIFHFISHNISYKIKLLHLYVLLYILLYRHSPAYHLIAKSTQMHFVIDGLSKTSPGAVIPSWPLCGAQNVRCEKCVRNFLIHLLSHNRVI